MHSSLVFFTVNQIPTEIYSNVRIFLVILTLAVQLLLLGLSGVILFNKLRKSIGNFAWGLTVVLLGIFGGILFYVLQADVNAQLVARFLLLVQIVMAISLIIESIYTGLSNYFKPYNKILLYLVSILPLVFLFENKFWGMSYLKEIFEIMISKLTFFAVFFSILTFIYYTIETILLWYAYSTKS